MNFDPVTIAEAKAAFAALDFTEENEQIAELERKIEECEAAIEAGRGRIKAVVAQQRDPKPDGFAAANALLEGVSLREAAAVPGTYDALEKEYRALTEGIRHLSDNIAHYRGQIRQVQGGAERRLSEAAAGLVETVTNEARVAAEQIEQCCAALRAVHYTTKAGVHEVRALERVRDGMVLDAHGQGLLAHKAKVEVPEEVVDALSSLAYKGGSALQIRLYKELPQ
ncbi:hypothetical protein [Altericroceibacterium xinjiangense]|uniref:hypothetical protein n=1 Tax=Altericroceibacterium xinjiangense TaxID=762261 RepID=UPI000F7DAA44|nr:hypothetical protein [Altericroceibacterium xinjiangense]